MKNHMRVVWGAFALLIAVFIAFPVLAAPVYRGTGDNGKPTSLTLLDTPCSDAAVLKHIITRIRPDLAVQFKNARLYWDGKEWASCWLEYQGIVYSIDEEGSALQPIPMDAFRDNAV